MSRRRAHHSASDRERILEEFRRAGSTGIAAFATAHGVKPRTMATWLARARARRPAEPPPFVTVDAAPEAAPPAAGHVELRCGDLCLRLPVAVGPEYLARLVAELGRSKPC